MPKVSLIVVNFNGLAVIQACLKAIAGQRFKDFELILLDNGSADCSLEDVKKLTCSAAFSHPVKIISLVANRGFAGGNIAALKHASFDFIALLNNDAEPDKSWLGNLVRAMEAAPDVGICASKMIVFGTEVIDSAGDGFSTNLKGFKRGEGLSSSSYDEQAYVFGACAGAALYRRKMLDEIGFFDEDFFLIHEDTDLNFRAQLAGWKVLYVPTAIAYHKVRSTIGDMSDVAIYYTLRNCEFVRIKNIPFLLFLRYLPVYIFGTIADFFYFAVKHRKPGLYIKAKIDVLKKLGMMLDKRKEIMSMKKVSDGYLRSMMTPVWEREFFLKKLKKLFSE